MRMLIAAWQLNTMAARPQTLVHLRESGAPVSPPPSRRRVAHWRTWRTPQKRGRRSSRPRRKKKQHNNSSSLFFCHLIIIFCSPFFLFRCVPSRPSPHRLCRFLLTQRGKWQSHHPSSRQRSLTTRPMRRRSRPRRRRRP